MESPLSVTRFYHTHPLSSYINTDDLDVLSKMNVKGGAMGWDGHYKTKLWDNENDGMQNVTLPEFVTP